MTVDGLAWLLPAASAGAFFPLYFDPGEHSFPAWKPWAAYPYSLVTAYHLSPTFTSSHVGMVNILVGIVTVSEMLVMLQRCWRRREFVVVAKCMALYCKRYPLSEEGCRLLLAVVALGVGIFLYCEVVDVMEFNAYGRVQSWGAILLATLESFRIALDIVNLVFPLVVIGALTIDLRRDVTREVAEGPTYCFEMRTRRNKWREFRVRRHFLCDFVQAISTLNRPASLFRFVFMAYRACLNLSYGLRLQHTDGPWLPAAAAVLFALLLILQLAVLTSVATWVEIMIASLHECAENLFTHPHHPITEVGDDLLTEVACFINSNQGSSNYLDLQQFKGAINAIITNVFVIFQFDTVKDLDDQVL